MKQCTRCKELKSLSEFSKDNSKKDKLSMLCRKCSAKKCRDRGKTRIGLITRIYNNQKHNAKRRNMDRPSYSLSELREYLLSMQLYHFLYDEWVSSEFDKNLVPSVDRNNPLLSYTFDNITLMTWRENRAKGREEIREKKVHNSTLLNGGHKAVEKLSLDGVLLDTYISVNEAARQNDGVHGANISKCCLGQNKTTGGFKWRHKV